MVFWTEDHAYGKEDCMALAKTNQAKAVNNADNYRVYAHEFKSKVPEWV